MSVSPVISSDDCIEFVRALSTLHRALGQRMTPLLEQEHGIDLRLFVLLKRIHGGCAHPGALASGSMESPSQITRQLDKLEVLGLIERTLDRADSRRIRLALTPKAHSLFDAVEHHFAQMIGPSLHALAPDDRRAMIAGVRSLGGALAGSF